MALAWTATANPTAQTGNVNSFTFTSVAIGTASADRIVVVGAGGRLDGQSIASCTIGGTEYPATKVVANAGAGSGGAIFALEVASGTTADIVVTLSATAYPATMGINVGILTGTTFASTGNVTLAYGAGDGNPFDFASALTIPTGGFGFVVAVDYAPNVAFTWANATKDYDTGLVSPDWGMGSAHSTTAGAWSPTASISTNYGNAAMIAAAWEPGGGTAVEVLVPSGTVASTAAIPTHGASIYYPGSVWPTITL